MNNIDEEESDNINKKSRIKFQAFYSTCFCDISHFEDNCTQSYLTFMPLYRYFKKIDSTDHVLA